MDRAKVAAGIAQKHKELLPFLYAGELGQIPKEKRDAALNSLGLRYGYEFIEKFIQVPFRLPPTDEVCVRAFIRSRLTMPEPVEAKKAAAGTRATMEPKAARAVAVPLAGGANAEPGLDATRMGVPNEVEKAVSADVQASQPPATSEAAVEFQPDESHLEEPLILAAQVLENNPRRLAQLVNLVRLQRRLAHELGLRQIREGQLAKWTAVALRWPMFLVDLEMEPEMLGQLVMAEAPENPSDRYLRWDAVRELVSFLRDNGPGGEDTQVEFDLTEEGAVDALLKLSVTVPVARVTAAATSKEAAAEEAARVMA